MSRNILTYLLVLFLEQPLLLVNKVHADAVMYHVLICCF